MSRIPYRPAIDGMRAVAVLAVLVFHLDKSVLPGGFVGVDVFFVISGYLITSIMYDATRAGGFSVVRFFHRRIARIFPVFLTVALATLVAAAVWYTSQDFATASEAACASALSITNFHLMSQGNYFEVMPDSQPFLHCWSLAVEEQFYVVLPGMFLAAQRFRFSRRRLLGLLGGLALASFVACLVVTYSKPVSAFYLLPTRAWELLAGSILAVAAHNPAVAPSRHRGRVAGIGLLLIVGSLFLIDESMAFPGWVAAVPVAGSVLVIGRSHHPRQLTERLLSHRGMVAVGKASYSLYLWHWPVYCFVDYRGYAEAAAVRFAAKVALTVAVSVASYFLVERPCRAFLSAPGRTRWSFVAWAVCVFAVAAGGIAIQTDQHVDAEERAVAAGGIAFPASPDGATVVLMGDSHGSMYGTAMKSLSARDRHNVHVISVVGGDPFPGSRLFDESIAFLRTRKPDVTVFAAAYIPKLDRGTERFAAALGEILQHSSFVVVIGQPPVLPPHATRQAFRSQGVVPVFEDPETTERRRRSNAALAAFESDRVKVLVVDSHLQTADGELMFRDAAGRQLFQDRGHLSGAGAERIVEPLSETIRGLLGRKGHEPVGSPGG